MCLGQSFVIVHLFAINFVHNEGLVYGIVFVSNFTVVDYEYNYFIQIFNSNQIICIASCLQKYWTINTQHPITNVTPKIVLSLVIHISIISSLDQVHNALARWAKPMWVYGHLVCYTKNNKFNRVQVVNSNMLLYYNLINTINLLWPSYTIWRHKSSDGGHCYRQRYSKLTIDVPIERPIS